MADDDEQFVQIPTMTFRKPKKKQRQNRAILIGIVLMGIAIAIFMVVWFLLL